MKILRLLLILIVSATVLELSAVIVHAQEFDFAQRIGDTLKEAGVPLTDQQSEKIKAIEWGPGAREDLNKILTEKQQEALQQSRGQRGRGQDFVGMMGRTLEEAGCPLTDEQREALGKIEPDDREKMTEILTKKQQEALQQAFGQRARGRGFVGMMGRTLEEAGCPLTDEQREALGKIEPDDREKMTEILTKKQQEALQQAFGQRGRGRDFVRMIGRTLNRADCPLTDEQLEAIRKIEPGSDAQEKINNLLTEKQREALKNAPRGERQTGRRINPIRMIGRTLRQAGEPLTDEQLEAIRKIEPGPDAQEKIEELLTEKQRKALEKAR